MWLREAPVGIEPTNGGFADLCLTTWLRRRAEAWMLLGPPPQVKHVPRIPLAESPFWATIKAYTSHESRVTSHRSRAGDWRLATGVGTWRNPKEDRCSTLSGRPATPRVRRSVSSHRARSLAPGHHGGSATVAVASGKGDSAARRAADGGGALRVPGRGPAGGAERTPHPRWGSLAVSAPGW